MDKLHRLGYGVATKIELTRIAAAASVLAESYQ
jgi:hypothetical protein